ncbi:MAG: amidohydrolase family protein, partial [Gallionella sp.]|nr:amidohydrolase family protein [Gallionella sp.]
MTTTGTDRIMLRCGVLIDGSGGDAREDIALVIDQGLITSVERWEDRDTCVEKACTVRDYGDETVIPGIIDAHAHLCLGSPQSAGWASAASDPIGIVAWGLASGLAALLSGVTTIVDAGSTGGLALRVASLVEDGFAGGPRILGVGRAITTTGGHGATFGVCADNISELVRAV